uniref:NADH-ubiquinone oxidoreductase chain 4L n=1 Tax=Oroperipatus sp. DVL-2011 TaxID=1035536 RepID=G1CDV1_9BILA|nr:NADH dehydrogenase subunit 4L [Oroperipatus sp. DVL-2011]AEK48383.1 NADH dehydrogenase subunit 4L [Oroperipatus sp. DVL-2011]
MGFQLSFLVPFIFIMAGIMTFVMFRVHLLSMLLSLEFIMLNVFWMMFSWLSYLDKEVYLSLFFLTLTACEASLGLSLLVSLIRSHGNDMFSSLSVVSW